MIFFRIHSDAETMLYSAVGVLEPNNNIAMKVKVKGTALAGIC